jgi:hypothetical protein
MPHAIIRGKNGRRHEVDFGDEPVRVEIYASEETVEIFVGADFETLPEERRRFALLNIPRHLFSEATAATARRAVNPVLLLQREVNSEPKERSPSFNLDTSRAQRAAPA